MVKHSVIFQGSCFFLDVKLLITGLSIKFTLAFHDFSGKLHKKSCFAVSYFAVA